MRQIDGIGRGRDWSAVPGLAAQWRSVSRSLAAAIYLLAGLVLVGRLAERALPSFVEVIGFSTSSAWLLLLLSLSLWLRDAYDGSLRKYSALCAAGALMAVLVSVIVLINSHLASGTWPDYGLGERQFLSPQAGLAFALIGFGLLLLDWETRSGVRPAQYAAVLAAAIGLLTLLGYVNSVPALYRVDPFPPISFHESAALLLLATAVLASRPDLGILRVVISDTAGGFLARSAPVAVVAFPIVAGWIALTGRRLGWYDDAAAVSVLVFTTTAFFSVLIFRVARTLDRSDLRRTRAEELLRLRALQRAALAELSQRALSEAESPTLAEEAVRVAVEALRVNAGELLKIQHDTGSLVVDVGVGPGSERGAIRDPASLPARVLASGQPTVIEDLKDEHRLRDGQPEAGGMVSAALVPIVSAVRRYGVLAVYTTERRSFTDDDVHLMQTVAGILAAARDRTLGEAALRLSEQKFSGLFRSSPDAIAVVTLADGRVQEINEGFLQMTGFARDETLGRRIGELRLWSDPLALRSTLDMRASVRNLELQLTTKSGETRVGLCSTEVVTLAGEPCMLIVVRDISERKRVQAAIQDANERLARWVNELEDRGREISVLSEMGELLQSCATPGEACRITVKVAQQLLPGSAGALCTFAEGGGLLEASAVWGGLSADEAVFSPQECWALRRGRPHAASDPDSGLLCAHVKHSQARTYLCVPMIAQSETIGVLHVRQTDEAFPGDTMLAWLGEPKQRLVVAIADHAALALANLRLRDTLRSQSIRDQLTGLHNRRYMQEVFERELLRARRGQSPIGVLLLDLDSFKSTNDTHGHDAGDEVLKQVGRLLQARLRGGDIVCRYGGEEFVLVLPQTTVKATLERAEEIRGAVQTLAFTYRDRALGPILVSIGVSVFPDHGVTLGDLLEAADAALYRAKARGGNCVDVAAARLSPEAHRDVPSTGGGPM